MNWIVTAILLGLGLSMDACAVSTTDGLSEPNMKWNKSLLISGMFGFFQMMMPVLGYLAVTVFSLILGENFTRIFADFLSVVWWVAIWDMVEILVLENQEIKWKRLNNQQLYDSTIKFVFDEEKEEDSKELEELINL